MFVWGATATTIRYQCDQCNKIATSCAHDVTVLALGVGYLVLGLTIPYYKAFLLQHFVWTNSF